MAKKKKVKSSPSPSSKTPRSPKSNSKKKPTTKKKTKAKPKSGGKNQSKEPKSTKESISTPLEEKSLKSKEAIEKPEIARDVEPEPLEGGEEAAEEILKALTELSDKEEQTEEIIEDFTKDPGDFFKEKTSPDEDEQPPPKKNVEELAPPPPDEGLEDPELKKYSPQKKKGGNKPIGKSKEELNSMQQAILDMAPTKAVGVAAPPSPSLASPPPVSEGLKPRKKEQETTKEPVVQEIGNEEKKPGIKKKKESRKNAAPVPPSLQEKETLSSPPLVEEEKKAGFFTKILRQKPKEKGDLPSPPTPIGAPSSEQEPVRAETAPLPPPPLPEEETLTPPPSSQEIPSEVEPIPSDERVEKGGLFSKILHHKPKAEKELPVPPLPLDASPEQSVDEQPEEDPSFPSESIAEPVGAKASPPTPPIPEEFASEEKSTQHEQEETPPPPPEPIEESIISPEPTVKEPSTPAAEAIEKSITALDSEQGVDNDSPPSFLEESDKSDALVGQPPLSIEDHEELQQLHEEIHELHDEMEQVISELTLLRESAAKKPAPETVEGPFLEQPKQIVPPPPSQEVPEYIQNLEKKFSDADNLWSTLKDVSVEDEARKKELEEAVLIGEAPPPPKSMDQDILSIPDSLTDEDLKSAERTKELAQQFSSQESPPPEPPPPPEEMPPPPLSELQMDVQNIRQAVGETTPTAAIDDQSLDLPEPPTQESIEVPTLLHLPKMDDTPGVAKRKVMIDNLHEEIQMLELENASMKEKVQNDKGGPESLSLGLVPIEVHDESLAHPEDDLQVGEPPLESPERTEMPVWDPLEEKPPKKKHKSPHKKSDLKKLHEELLQHKLKEAKRPIKKARHTSPKKKISGKKVAGPTSAKVNDEKIQKQDQMLKEMRDEIKRLRDEQTKMRSKLGESPGDSNKDFPIEEASLEEITNPEPILEEQVTQPPPRPQVDPMQTKRMLEVLANQLRSYLDTHQLDQATEALERIKNLRRRLGAIDLGNLQYELVGLEAEVKLAKLS